MLGPKILEFHPTRSIFLEKVAHPTYICLANVELCSHTLTNKTFSYQMD